MQTVIVPSLRPDEIILAYWREVLFIEEDAEMFNPEHMEII